MTSSENIEDFKEVTPAQMDTIKNQDAKYEAPSEELKAQAKAEGAEWNPATGYFELNGLADISTAQMRQILPYLAVGRATGDIAYKFQKALIRTITLYSEGSTPGPKNMDYAFYGSAVETIMFKSTTHPFTLVSSINDILKSCPYIREVYGVLDLSRIKSGTIIIASSGAAKLKSIQLNRLNTSISFSTQPLLSLESITYMVENATNTAPITITLHPDAYARLTDELIEKASARQITFATTQ